VAALVLAVLVAVAAGLVAGSATAGGSKKLVEGTVYDATCATACVPECPPIPCGPVTQGAREKVVCAQQRRMIVCPLHGQAGEEASPPICLPASGCVFYPVYKGEGAVINVRRRGSGTLLATLPVVEGHFEIRLGPGEYILHPYLREEPCWSGVPSTVHVRARWKGPVSASVNVSNSCVAHPDAR